MARTPARRSAADASCTPPGSGRPPASPAGVSGSDRSGGEERDAAIAAAVAQATLPYNTSNMLLSRADVDTLLSAYTGGGGAAAVVCRDHGLYLKALTHRSYCTRKNESFLSGNALCPAGCVPLQRDSNERLEFLGDAVLYLAASSYLIERYPACDEGFLTRMRTKIVCGTMLSTLCQAAGLHRFVIMSRQVEEAHGREARNVLEDAFEAFLGAIYLDVGFDAAHRWLVSFLEAHVDFAQLVNSQNNPKDVLNRYMQRNQGALPTFEDAATQEGGATVVVRHRGAVLSTGTGATRRDAEDDAARRALAYMNVPGCF